jgi:hypothetical protein
MVNPSVLQSITYLFGCIYHTKMCSQILATFSYKGDPKIHPDAPRNVCGVRTAAGRFCRVLTHRSPNQMIILSNNHVFVMFHVTYDIIVQTLSPFMTSIFRNVQWFPELPVDSTDWISLTLVLTWTWPISLSRVIYLPNPVPNLTRGLTWSHPHIVATSD